MRTHLIFFCFSFSFSGRPNKAIVSRLGDLLAQSFESGVASNLAMAVQVASFMMDSVVSSFFFFLVSGVFAFVGFLSEC